MQIINIHEAKTHFSKWVDAAYAGEEIVIAKAGKPTAQLGPLKSIPPRKFGVLKGKITVADDFDAPLPDEILEHFED